MEELNLGDINTSDFIFEYSSDTYTITATTQPSFGKAGIKVICLSDKSFTVEVILNPRKTYYKG